MAIPIAFRTKVGAKCKATACSFESVVCLFPFPLRGDLIDTTSANISGCRCQAIIKRKRHPQRHAWSMRFLAWH